MVFWILSRKENKAICFVVRIPRKNQTIIMGQFHQKCVDDTNGKHSITWFLLDNFLLLFSWYIMKDLNPLESGEWPLCLGSHCSKTCFYLAFKMCCEKIPEYFCLLKKMNTIANLLPFHVKWCPGGQAPQTENLVKGSSHLLMRTFP